MNALPRIPELLAPAGSFSAAMAAFEGGADAVYLGFTEFSARKQARNFGRDEYLRLRSHALAAGKRLYVAMNTVLFESESDKAAEALTFLATHGVDAVIMQDFGLMSLARDRFPELRIHASTQAAVHTAEAARLAAALGIRRVVLPRETGIEATRRLVASCPDMEFESFAHGALCYSFSGLCLASGRITGRSGNRGDCAQPCRSFYEWGSKGRGCWFSCKDLDLADLAADLAAAGVAAIKIEGRMKSPEYAFAASRLYRTVLDAMKNGTKPERGMLERLRVDAMTAFSRAPTTGYARDVSGVDLIDSSYPGHRGVPCGTVINSGGGRLMIRLAKPLGERDGLLAFRGTNQVEPFAFSARDLRDPRSLSQVRRAGEGSTVSMEFEGTLHAGSEVRKISSRDQDRRETNPLSFPIPALDVPCALSGIGTEGATARLEFRLPDGRKVPKVVPVALTGGVGRASVTGSFLKAAQVFGERGERRFVLRLSSPELADAATVAGERIPLADAFVPPSILKRAKNGLYDSAEAALRRLMDEYASESAAAAPTGVDIPGFGAEESIQDLPSRSALIYDAGIGLPFPFATRAALGGPITAHPRVGSNIFVPLAPVTTDTDAYLSAARGLAERFLDCHPSGRPADRLLFGVNGFHHAAFVAGFSKVHGSIGSFVDLFGYCANARAVAAWANASGGSAFAYFYVEADEVLGKGGSGRALADLKEKITSWGFDAWGIIPVDGNFLPPLFVSRGCFRKHSDSACPSCGATGATPGPFRYELGDRNRRYVVAVVDCVTYLFEALRASGSRHGVEKAAGLFQQPASDGKD
ncbi:MAG: U32 family peptidase [Spirochaetes bacterium]|nr:U32 family peptidase [Spirochaetota bacterium]